MNTALLKKYGLFIFFWGVLLAMPFQIKAQKSRPAFNNIQGHNLYKQAKLYDSEKGAIGGKPIPVGDRAADRINYEFELLKDPNTGKIPVNIRAKELAFSNKLPNGSSLKKNFNKKGALSIASEGNTGEWNARGPGNVGGRTRAIAIDILDENTLFAGGISGGLWRSTDTGASWNRVTGVDQNPGITAIAQDPRIGFNNIWYYVSGEVLGNSVSVMGGGAVYQGVGVFKSTDNGVTWSRIVDSNNLDVRVISSLDFISNVAVSPLNGDMYFSASNGIFRIKSTAPTVVELALDANLSLITEVKISPSGKIYATASKEDGVDGDGNSKNINAGILVSDDGDTWINITPSELALPAVSFGKVILEIDPSNENNVWFLADNITSNNEFLWKYQADAAPGSEWSDRSLGLPKNLGAVGNLELQDSYNMVLKVHPSNSNIVFIGGTNLYRSTNGFTNQPTKSDWIGGYSNAGGYALYKNHHPDQHNLLFFPSNPSIALSANDGGIQITQDILQGATSWTSLNNGYLTTQPYAVSLDPSGNSDALLAGFQDNGTWYTSSTNLEDPWFFQFSGDGSYGAIADAGNTLYVSSQGGNAFRYNYDADADTYTYARITPKIATGGFEFIAPFILDHNDDNIMYMPSGGSMLVNTNLDEIPTGSDDPTSVNWFQVKGNPLGTNIVAMDVSTYPVQHRLYFGARGGGFFRVDNAHLPGATRSSNLAGSKGMGPGQINCVYVDPTNSDRVFVVKSNYGVKSIWLSEDAGNNWTSVSGNLEENADGTGNGPSVRWITMIGNNDGYLIGTSTGMYTTNLLNGNNTVWNREVMNVGSETIEDVAVVQVKSRNDGFAVAATHGNGIFSAYYNVTARPEPTLSTVQIEKILISNDIEFYNFDISGKFISSTNSPINITVSSNSNPSLVTVNIVGNELQFTGIDPTKEGELSLILEATSGLERTTLVVSVVIRETGIYEQDTDYLYATPSNYDRIGERLSRCADDFIVPEGSTWNVNRVVALGSSVFQGTQLVDNATVEIFADDNGKPGNLVYTTGKLGGLNNVVSDDFENLDLNIPFPADVVLQSGKYWLVVYAHLSWYPYSRNWAWANTDEVVGNEAQFINPGGFYYSDYDHPDNPNYIVADWTNESTVFAGEPLDHLFYILGTVSDKTTLGVEEVGFDGFMVFPNPNNGEFTVKFNGDLSRNIKVNVYDILGRNVYSNSYSENGIFNQHIKLNNVTSGIYLLKVSDGLKTAIEKIIIE